MKKNSFAISTIFKRNFLIVLFACDINQDRQMGFPSSVKQDGCFHASTNGLSVFVRECHKYFLSEWDWMDLCLYICMFHVFRHRKTELSKDSTVIGRNGKSDQSPLGLSIAKPITRIYATLSNGRVFWTGCERLCLSFAINNRIPSFFWLYQDHLAFSDKRKYSKY